MDQSLDRLPGDRANLRVVLLGWPSAADFQAHAAASHVCRSKTASGSAGALMRSAVASLAGAAGVVVPLTLSAPPYPKTHPDHERRQGYECTVWPS